MASTVPVASNSRHSGSNSASVGYRPFQKQGRTAAALKPSLATRRSSAIDASTLWSGRTRSHTSAATGYGMSSKRANTGPGPEPAGMPQIGLGGKEV